MEFPLGMAATRSDRGKEKYTPANAYGESSVAPVSPFYYGHLASEIASRTVEDLVGVAMLGGGKAVMGMASHAVVRMGVRHDGRPIEILEWLELETAGGYDLQQKR